MPQLMKYKYNKWSKIYKEFRELYFRIGIVLFYNMQTGLVYIMEQYRCMAYKKLIVVIRNGSLLLVCI